MEGKGRTMTNQEIFELMSRFEGSSLRAMKVTRGDCTLELERGSAAPRAAVLRCPYRACS